MLASALVEEIAKDLNDFESGNEYVRWPQTEILEFVVDAARQLALLKPESASHTDIITLVPGTAQTLPDGCHDVSDITANITADGRELDPPSKSDYSALTSVRRKACLVAGGDYRVSNFAIDKNDRHKFYVSPPVPITVPPTVAKVKVTCSGVGPGFGLTDEIPIHAAYHNQLREYALYRAWYRDTESQSSVRRGDSHKGEFYNSLRIRILAEQVMKKEEKEMP
jgi:hypothetical protein